MSGPTARRDLGLQFSKAQRDGCTKMATVTASIHAACEERNPDQRQVILPATHTYSQVAQGTPRPPLVPSPASTESLLGRTMEDYSLSPVGPALPRMQTTPSPGMLAQDQVSPHQDLFLKLSDLLERGLANTADKISRDLKSDFTNPGTRKEAIEHKLDIMVAAHIQVLQDQLDTALSRIDDLENRSRRYKFRLRSLPKTVTEISTAVQGLIRDLLPNTPPYRLEMDRAHRALGPPTKDRSPRDIIVKPHFYAVKEEVMRQSRSQSKVLCLGHQVQIFADLSPTTIQKRRTLKPLLMALTQQDIKYRWAFLFAVKFSIQGKSHSFSSEKKYKSHYL